MASRFLKKIIGKNFKSLKAFLERRYSEDLNVEAGINIALLSLRDCAEGKLTEDNVEVAVVKTENGKATFRRLSPDEVKEYLDSTE